MHRPNLVVPSLLISLLVAACGDDAGSQPASAAPASTQAPASVEPPGCERSEALEADFSGKDPGDWAGPGVDPATGAPRDPGEGGYVVATTRLNLSTDGAELFSKHVGAILGEIQKQPGFVAYQVGLSSKCNVARTLSVWKDEESLYAFVTGPAHKAAMNDTSKMSRGYSNTTHFKVSQASEISWSAAARAIAGDDGPFY